MSYLDDLNDLLGIGTTSDDDAPAVEGCDPISKARADLEGGRRGYFEAEPGTWRFCGTRTGCGFAEGTLTVDAATGDATIDIDCHLAVSPERVRPLRKIFRHVNNQLIVTGLVVDDEGRIRFVTEGLNVLDEGEDVDVSVGRALSTVHGYAWMATALEAGADPWELLNRDSKKAVDDDESEGGLAARLRSLLD